MPEWLYDEPLRQIEGEPAYANEALHIYAVLGATRTKRDVQRALKMQEKEYKRGERDEPPFSTRYTTILSWARRYDWDNRIIQWEMNERTREEAMWKERRQQVREDDWSHAKQLRELAEKALKMAPAFVKRTQRVADEGTPRVVDMEGNVIREGRPKEIVTTVALDVSDLEKIEKLASKLARLAAEMDEVRSRVMVDWREEAQGAGIDPNELFEKVVRHVLPTVDSGDNGADAGSD